MDKVNIAYMRISLKKEDPLNQERAIQKFANEPLIFFKDIMHGDSEVNERAGYSDMLEYIEKNHPEKLYVYEVSRIGRSFYETLRNIHDLEDKGVMVYSVREAFLNQSDPNTRKLMLSVFAWVADQELQVLRERTRNALAQKKAMLKEQGYFISRRGEKITHLGRKERIIEWDKVNEYLVKGLSYSAICKLMDYNYIWFIRKKNKKI
jgi:putative DNA-invertase from lambdoid prophage Rac